MKSKHIIALIAALLFLVSYFLPAHQNAVGYECFVTCLEHNMGPYYAAFVLTNVLFVALVVAFFPIQRFARFRWFLSLVLLLHVFSWFFFNALGDYQNHTLDNLRQIQIGYYVWLLAYGLLFWAHCFKGQVPRQVTGPNARTASVTDSGATGRTRRSVWSFFVRALLAP